MRVTPARLWLTLGLLAAVAAGAGWWAWSAFAPAPAAPATAFDPPRPLPEITLTDKRGDAWTPVSLRGHWSVLTFGCTACPRQAIATLARLDRVVVRLERAGRLPPRPVFATVDPERDSAERVRRYLERVNPWFQGLTGPVAALERLREAVGAGEARDLFVIDPRARAVARLPASSSAEALARRLARLMAVRTESPS